MKMFILSLALFSVCSVNAQYLTNGGFESWSNQIIYQTPNNWFTFNQLAIGSTPTPVTKVTDAHSGSFAAKLSSTIISFGGSNDTIPGFMIYGDYDIAGGGNPGVPFTFRPDSIVGYYKSNLIGGDSASVYVYLSKYDNVSGNSSGIGFSNNYITQNATTYKRFSFPIEYDPITSALPDTLTLGFGIGAQTFNLASTVTFDDVQLVYNVSSVDELEPTTFNCYPNPVNTILVIESTLNDNFKIYNALGQVIEAIQVLPDSKTALNCSQLEEGIYFIKGTNGVANKFVVKH